MTALDQQVADRRAARLAEMPTSLAEALAVLQTRLPEVKKSETAHVKSDKGNYSYRYTNLAGITRDLMPVLGELGLSFTARPTLTSEGKFVLAYELMHTSGGRIAGEYPLPTTGSPQAIGGHITYARRYVLCAITGVAPEDDDDDAAAAEAEHGQRGTAQRAPRVQQRPPTGGTGQPATERPTAQRASRATVSAAGPPLPGEVDPVTEPQLPKVIVMFDKVGITDRTERLDLSSLVVGRKLDSAKDLTKAEARALIDRLEQASRQDDPTSWLYESVRSQPDGQPEEPS